jgi:hypothetical protein
MSYGTSVAGKFTYRSGSRLWRELIKGKERGISFVMKNCME